MKELLISNYKALRARHNAFDAFQIAKSDAARGRESYVHQSRQAYSHGDVLRKNGRSFVVGIFPDDDTAPPWERAEGHGGVSDWTTRDKAPGELILNADGRSRRFYDFAGACATARRDWGLSPENVAALESKLGRKPTRRQIAAEAARLDFEFIRGWCNDSWRYVGVALFELPRDGSRISPEEFADSQPWGRTESAALWGIESCAEEYIQETIVELFWEI